MHVVAAGGALVAVGPRPQRPAVVALLPHGLLAEARAALHQDLPRRRQRRNPRCQVRQRPIVVRAPCSNTIPLSGHVGTLQSAVNVEIMLSHGMVYMGRSSHSSIYITEDTQYY